MSEQADPKSFSSAGKNPSGPPGFNDDLQEELGLSESVGFAVKQEGTTAETPAPSSGAAPAVEPSKAAESAPPQVPSGPDLGLSESVGFIQPAGGKASAAAAKPSAPPRPHPTNRLEQAWANMAPVEIQPREEPKKGNGKKAKAPKNQPALPPPKVAEATRQAILERSEPAPKPAAPVSAAPAIPPVVAPVAKPTVAAVAKPVAAIPSAPVPAALLPAVPAVLPGQEQIEFLQNQIRQLRIWAYTSTVLSVILVLLLWVVRPPGTANPPAENPPTEVSAQ